MFDKLICKYTTSWCSRKTHYFSFAAHWRNFERKKLCCISPSLVKQETHFMIIIIKPAMMRNLGFFFHSSQHESRLNIMISTHIVLTQSEVIVETSFSAYMCLCVVWYSIFVEKRSFNRSPHFHCFFCLHVRQHDRNGNLF